MERLLTLLFATMLAGQALAQNFTIDNLNYEVINAKKKYVSVRKAEVELKDSLIIPAEVKNGKITYQVISIADSAFFGCSDLTSVDIPKSVTSIGRSAFYGCRGLTIITIPASTIYEDAFRDCSGLISVVIQRASTIEKAAFSGCANLTSITLPAYACGQKVPNPNICIYEYPFGYIFGENEYDGGERTTQRYYYSYIGYGSDPNSPKEFGTVAYYIPANLKEIIVTGGGDIRDGAFSFCRNIISVTINGVGSIGQSAFLGCETLESIDISNSVKNIGENAFSGCSSLVSITIPKSVSGMGKSVFNGCDNLTIYCEAESIPVTWNGNWNNIDRPVVWDILNPCNRGHTVVIDKGVSPTCTESGLTDGSHCSVCGKVLVAQKRMPAFGHKFGNYIYNNDATIDRDGTETATCIMYGCGATDTRIVVGTKLKSGTAVSESAANAVNIYAHGNTIVVENATAEICIYDAEGRLVGRYATPCVRAELQVNTAGVFIVKVGNVAKRVMVN